MAISWLIISILLKALTGFLPSFIVFLSLLPDPDNFLENYRVLTEPSGSNNPQGSYGEGSGGSSGNGGSTGPGGNSGPDLGSAVGNQGGNSQSEKGEDRVKSLYSAYHPEAGTNPFLAPNGLTCLHYGQMEHVAPTPQPNAAGGHDSKIVMCIRASNRAGYYVPPKIIEPSHASETGG